MKPKFARHYCAVQRKLNNLVMWGKVAPKLLVVEKTRVSAFIPASDHHLPDEEKPHQSEAVVVERTHGREKLGDLSGSGLVRCSWRI
jgi:hypothetical protein